MAHKEYNEEEIKEIIDNFEDMDTEEYEKSSPELRSIYVSFGLEERRKKYMEKSQNALKYSIPIISQFFLLLTGDYLIPISGSGRYKCRQLPQQRPVARRVKYNIPL